MLGTCIPLVQFAQPIWTASVRFDKKARSWTGDGKHTQYANELIKSEFRNVSDAAALDYLIPRLRCQLFKHLASPI